MGYHWVGCCVGPTCCSATHCHNSVNAVPDPECTRTQVIKNKAKYFAQFLADKPTIYVKSAYIDIISPKKVTISGIYIVTVHPQGKPTVHLKIKYFIEAHKFGYDWKIVKHYNWILAQY
jgi:hypothetical protein